MDDLFKPKNNPFYGINENVVFKEVDLMGVDFEQYMSPISLAISQAIDEGVVGAAMKAEVTVDKQELLRAIEYDRNQFAEGFKAGKKAAQPKWISVEERLPEESGSYLVCTRRSDAFTARFYLNTNEWKSHFAGSAGKHITHWMPMPPAPNETTTPKEAD